MQNESSNSYKAYKKVINTSEKGTIFVLLDFSYIADHVQVGICLKKIYNRAGLERVMRGFYTNTDNIRQK